jgi:ParB family transcriptional regulator, chromosome partitioning protein
MVLIRETSSGKKTKVPSSREKLKDRQANLNNHKEGGFCQVALDSILLNPEQPRKYFDPTSLAELSKSIKQMGVLQPIIIRRDDIGRIFLVAGERRLKAAKMAALTVIPAILTKGNPIEISLIENLQRENLKPIEAAEALNRMLEEYHYTHSQLALLIGKARSTITETLSLSKLPEAVKLECRHADKFPRRLLVEIAKQETPEDMLVLFNNIKENDLRSGEVRKLTRTKRPEKQRNVIAITLEKVSSLHKQLKALNEIDLAATNELEKYELIAELQQLKNAIELILT